MTELLTLIIGLLGGFYARTIFNYVKSIYFIISESYSANKAGVVRPNVVKQTRSQPINLESQSGGIRRLTPDEVLLEAQKAHNERLKSL